jgi:hypothetical protein
MYLGFSPTELYKITFFSLSEDYGIEPRIKAEFFTEQLITGLHSSQLKLMRKSFEWWVREV